LAERYLGEYFLPRLKEILSKCAVHRNIYKSVIYISSRSHFVGRCVSSSGSV